MAQRIQRFAKLVGAENVIAGADCGFGGRSHPQIAWAKLEALAQGAELAAKSEARCCGSVPAGTNGSWSGELSPRSSPRSGTGAKNHFCNVQPRSSRT